MSVKLHIEATGPDAGRPVILIHGWPLSGKAWAHQVPALAEAGFRVITYDRRGFGQSEKPASGFDYDTLAQDLADLMESHDLRDASLVGFSMGGGEVARYIANHGESRLRSVVFASAVPPFLMKSDDNPEGPLTEDAAQEMEDGLRADRDAFFDQFTRDFFSADGALKVSEEERQKAIALCKQSDQAAALGCMEAFGTTDFREDLKKVSLPTLVLHGDSDGIVPFEGSGARTKAAIHGSQLALIEGGPHGVNVSHAEAFNAALIGFLSR
ncbi:alpha/beta fold hydrolase [Pseudorhodobacter sp. MZDSW-24AT]|uniref:alpha/beta fold hydrolase n=1 Tax=Pseudorhodobacter sp. MZDSW-24AT TaxID=2052957 RepID=UPI000C1DF4B5|nr:alpha/beta hydrolase [Pseudorhodobacter sp. MZDSW-24AT]PJF09688.1 alpha/beta hydrolase [Pseudorhodobacter sp. MZDSW-24AT]